MLVVVRSDQRHQVRNRHASQGDVNAPTLPLLGRQPSKESKSLGGQRSYGIKWLRGPAITEINLARGGASDGRPHSALGLWFQC